MTNTFLEDLLTQERLIRTSAQEEVRAYQSLLHALAIRFQSYQLEDEKQSSPDFYEGWTTTEWEQFWDTYQPNFTWGQSNKEEFISEIQKLRRLVETSEEQKSVLLQKNHHLRNELGDTKRQLDNYKALSKIQVEAENDSKKPQELKNIPKVYREAVRALRSLPNIAPPKAFLHKFKENVQRWPYKHRMIYLMANYGWSSRFELQSVVALAEGMPPRVNTLRRAMTDLEETGLITHEKLMVESQPGKISTFILLKLNPDGRRLSRVLGWEPVMPEEFSIENMKAAGRIISFTQ